MTATKLSSELGAESSNSQAHDKVKLLPTREAGGGNRGPRNKTNVEEGKLRETAKCRSADLPRAAPSDPLVSLKASRTALPDTNRVHATSVILNSLGPHCLKSKKKQMKFI